MIETFYNIPDAPRLALLGDFHNNSHYTDILNSLCQKQPDLICIAGDITYASIPEDKS